jgi:hypothetical protein
MAGLSTDTCLVATGCDSCAGNASDGTGTLTNGDIDDDGVCNEDEVLGCTNAAACNLDDDATDDDGSCLVPAADTCEICDGEAIASGDENQDDVCDVDQQPGCDGELGSGLAVDDCGQCGGLNANQDCNNICSGDLAAGVWVNGNPGSQDPDNPPYIYGAATDGSWSLSDCGYTPGSGVNTPNDDGTVSITAEYSTGGCLFESSVFTGTVSIATSSTHNGDMSLADIPSFTLTGGSVFSLSSTGTYAGFDENGSLTGDLTGGSLGGASLDCADVCGGDSTEDSCGVCDNDSSNDDTPLTGTCDCAGDPSGQLENDCFGDCDGAGYLDDDSICVYAAFDPVSDLVAVGADDESYGPHIRLSWTKDTDVDLDGNGFSEVAYRLYQWKPYVCGDGVCDTDLGEAGGDGGCYDDCGCLDGQFECATGGWQGNCIPASWECDGGSPDCTDGSDEADCSADPVNNCDDDEHWCNGSGGWVGDCIPGTWVCDGGSPDCNDGSDEAGCALNSGNNDQNKLDLLSTPEVALGKEDCKAFLATDGISTNSLDVGILDQVRGGEWVNIVYSYHYSEFTDVQLPYYRVRNSNSYNGMTYDQTENFMVRSVNLANGSNTTSGDSNEASATSPDLAAPTGLSSVDLSLDFEEGYINFNWSYPGYDDIEYPQCAGTAAWLGNGTCNEENNNPLCGYDDGDCCESSCVGDDCADAPFDTCYDPENGGAGVPTCNEEYNFGVIALESCYNYSSGYTITWNVGCSGVVYQNGSPWFSTTQFAAGTSSVTAYGFSENVTNNFEFAVDGVSVASVDATTGSENCDEWKDEWLCNQSYFNGSDGCDCDCGYLDPDCGEDGNALSIYGCAGGETCSGSDADGNLNGTCAPAGSSGGCHYAYNGSGYSDTDCDEAYNNLSNNYTCEVLATYGWNCTGCECPGDATPSNGNSGEDFSELLNIDNSYVKGESSTAYGFATQRETLINSGVSPNGPDLRLLEGFTLYKQSDDGGFAAVATGISTLAYQLTTDDPAGTYHVTAYDSSPSYESAASNDHTVSEPQCTALGDTNGDGGINVADIVSLVNAILYNDGDATGLICGDLSGNGIIDVSDIVSLVNIILGAKDMSETNDATEATIHVADNAISVEANGMVQGVQMTISHCDNFSIELTNAYISNSATKDNTTTLVIATDGSYSIADVATFEGIINNVESSYVVNSSSDEVTINDTIVQAAGLDIQLTGPNPFNPATSFNVVVPEAGFVSVNVYNILGQNVATLVNGYMDASSTGHSITWDAGNLASGVYLVRAITAEQVTTQKLMLLK